MGEVPAATVLSSAAGKFFCGRAALRDRATVVLEMKISSR
jgi:hypothetical protein